MMTDTGKQHLNNTNILTPEDILETIFMVQEYVQNPFFHNLGKMELDH